MDDRKVGRSPRLDTVEPKLSKIEFVHKDVDHPNWIASPIQSPRHSGNSVLCPRSVPSTKRLIRSTANGAESYREISAFSHSQGHSRPGWASGKSGMVRYAAISNRQ